MKFFICALSLLFAVSSHAADVSFFPEDGIAFNPHSALLRSPAIGAVYTHDTLNRKSYISYDFGIKIPGVRWSSDGTTVDVGGYGGIYTRYQLYSQSFNFVAADFRGALFTDVRAGRALFETAVYHQSSHLGDDYIRYDFGIVKNTGYEAVKEYFSWRFSDLFSASLGAEYKFSRRPRSLIFYDLSFFLGGRLDLLPNGLPLFIEAEVEAIADRYTPNAGIRIGLYLNYLLRNVFQGRTERGPERNEFSVGYYNGYSRLGSFYNKREGLVMAGFSFRYL